MNATKTTPPQRDFDTTPVSTEAQAARMESEGQGQTAPDPVDTPARGAARAVTRGEGVEGAPASESAEADQDIDTAGTEMDEER